MRTFTGHGLSAYHSLKEVKFLSMKKLILFLALSLIPLLPQPALAGEKVTRLEIKVEPGTRIRPLETAVIQVRVFGEVEKKDKEILTGRLKKTGAKVRVVSRDGGWISKEFKYQGTDDGPFVSGENRFFQVLNQATIQDCFLYSAPDRPGRYTIEASLDGKTATVVMDVSTSAQARKPAERQEFRDERASRDSYFELAEHYAPFVAQETWFQPKADYITRFDYDGDWRGDNNWDSLDQGTSQAYVYYTVMETESHWFVIYNLFHPRDYSDTCIVGTCHENDNEGLILTVAKDRSQFGRLQAMETLAHNNIYSFRADSQVRNGFHDIDGEVELYQGSHPVIFIESGGHGVYGGQGKHSRYSLSNDTFSAGTGVTFIYRGRAERPRHANDREVGYALLPIYEEWWERANSNAGREDRTFDKYYDYQPVGNRPRPQLNQIAGAFYGRKEASDKAKPFWGWEDKATKKKNLLAVGQWGLDPAYGARNNLSFPDQSSFSLEYIYNPYLGIDRRSSASRWQPDRNERPTGSSRDNRRRSDDDWDDEPVSGPNDRFSSTDRDRDRDGRTNLNRRRCDLKFYISGTDEVEIEVSGTELYSPQERRRQFRNADSDFRDPLPRYEVSGFTVKQREGSGRVILVEKPGRENNYTARLRVTPASRSEEYYFVRLKWEE